MRVVRVAGFVIALGALVAGLESRHVLAHDVHEMGAHMQMSPLRPMQPGDAERAAKIVVAARKFADGYTDYRKALADGYTVFHPEIKQDVYHFTNNATALDTTVHFDPARPTSLLYEKKGAGYTLVGVMYTAPFRTPEEELNRRVPLSVTQWHLHTNLCLPPRGEQADLMAPGTKFGLQGSIVTAEACQAAGGSFLPHLFGWMVHVYPFETDPKKIWSEGMEDEHGMGHDAAMPGMKM